MKKSIMAAGAHADDNELHFGGTLFKYQDQGYQIIYLQTTNNMSGSKRFEGPDGRMRGSVFPPAETMAFRKAECDEAAKLFHTTPTHLNHPQRQYHGPEGHTVEVRYGSPRPDCVPENAPSILTAYSDEKSVASLTNLILENDPEVIFTHGYGESNIEHYASARLLGSAYWKAVEKGYGGSLLLSTREFTHLGRMACCWETFVDIDGFIDRRMEAVRKHVSQYPPNWEGGAVYWRKMAEYRGGICGVKAAETFNFVNPAEPGPEDGELLAELLRNRAPDRPWGWESGWKHVM